MQRVSATRLSLGRTGNLPVPLGNLPGGMGKREGLLNPVLNCRVERRPRSVRQVAGRHRQVACATHCYRTSPTFNRTPGNQMPPASNSNKCISDLACQRIRLLLRRDSAMLGAWTGWWDVSFVDLPNWGPLLAAHSSSCSKTCGTVATLSI